MPKVEITDNWDYLKIENFKSFNLIDIISIKENFTETNYVITALENGKKYTFSIPKNKCSFIKD